jgi:hypothetical protein
MGRRVWPQESFSSRCVSAASSSVPLVAPRIAAFLAHTCWGVLGLIGIVIVGVLPKAAPKPPPGMRAVQCLRCNALQNVPDSQTTFECWQCKLVSNVDESVPRPSHMRNQKSE